MLIQVAATFILLFFVHMFASAFSMQFRAEMQRGIKKSKGLNFALRYIAPMTLGSLTILVWQHVLLLSSFLFMFQLADSKWNFMQGWMKWFRKHPLTLQGAAFRTASIANAQSYVDAYVARHLMFAVILMVFTLLFIL